MTLSLRTKLGYGMGHVQNDLCSAMWFSYLLLYFTQVLKFPSKLAGVVLLIGQVADALSTPFVGHEADRTDDLLFCVRYGRRKTWHLVGTICVSITFVFIFIGCMGCWESSYYYQIFYFAPFVCIFQFGWASTQISHLAILPTLCSDQHDRTELNAIRYGFTVISTITVYCITWLILGLNSSNFGQVLNSLSQSSFNSIVFIVLGIGIFFSIGFHIFVKEDNNPRQEVIDGDELSEDGFSPMMWYDWFSEPQLYIVGLMYMSTRLFCNLTQAYIPLYLQDTLLLSEVSVAYIPLVMYVSGFINTLLMKPINKLIGRKWTYLEGCCLGLAGSLWIYFGKDLIFREYFLYVVAVLMGSGCSTMLVTSLSITADFIGKNIECGAFVYGLMSFTDKLSNGVAVMLIQSLTPCIADDCSWKLGATIQGGVSYYRYVLAFACGGSALLGMFSLLLLVPFKIGQRRRKKPSLLTADNITACQSEDNAGRSGGDYLSYAPVSEEDKSDDMTLDSRPNVPLIT